MLKTIKISIAIYIITQIAIASFSLNSIAYYLTKFDIAVAENILNHQEYQTENTIVLFNEINETETETNEENPVFFKYITLCFTSFHNNLFNITDNCETVTVLKQQQIQYNPSFLHIATFLFVADLRI